MPRRLTPRSSIENLKKEAKRWLRALRAGDRAAGARLLRALPGLSDTPTLRDVQLALAREYGFAGWTDLVREVRHRSPEPVPEARDAAIDALHAAAAEGKADQIAAILDVHGDIVNERTGTGARTALHRAVFGRSEPAVAALLARGADPNIRDNDPRTGEMEDGDNAMPLHFAAESGHLGIVRRLVEHGADTVGDDTSHELNVLGWATCFENVYHLDVAEYLLRNGARHTIHTAVAMGDTAAIREIAGESRAELDRPMDPTNRRRRPLHLAVIKRQPASLATLLELGAETGVEDAAGLTPLDQAALAGEEAMAEQLIAAGTRVGLPAAVALGRADDVDRLLRDEPDGLRPGGRWARLIIRAAERAPGAVIERLIRAGASVHVRDDYRTAVDQTHGYTALHAAAFHGNTDAVRVLLRHGADPTVREDRYWGTPAGWADHAGHTEARDLILDGPIDIFDALVFDRLDRIDEILTRDPQALERRIAVYVNGKDRSKPWLDAEWTPLAYAVVHGKIEALKVLLERQASTDVTDSAGRSPVDLAREREQPEMLALLEASHAMESRQPSATGGFDQRVADFLLLACGDWRVAGNLRQRQARDALRLLEREPAIARSGIHAAVTCGELDEVRRILDERPESVSQLGGPRGWPPILYLCSARLPLDRAIDNAPAVLRLLLERGADPNVFYLGGNADIHYTALTCVLGRGEEIGPMHPRARELAALLLEHGADPHDSQVLYNVFADNTSRHLLDDDIVWLLDLMYEHSIRRGHAADWANPDWPMFDMRGAPSLGDEGRVHRGARFMLDAAIDRNLLRMAEWLLEHGAGPNTPPGELWRGKPKRPLYQEALARGHTEMAELLVRYAAERTPVHLEGIDAFVSACLALDVDRVRAILDRHPEYLHDHRPAFAAIEHDRDDVLAMLLDIGTSPNVRDANGTRALHTAAAKNAVRCGRLLIERGADIDPVESSYGSTPIGWASWFNNPEMMQLLAEYSRNAWTLTFRGFTERLKQVLEDEPEQARATNDEGQTLLFWLPEDEEAALEAANLLLEHGADPALRDRRGIAAMDVAERRGMARVAARLREGR